MPKVRMIIGVEMNFKIGLTAILSKPSATPAMTNPFKPSLTTNPGTSQWAIPKATEFEKSLIIKANIGFSYDIKKAYYGQFTDGSIL